MFARHRVATVLGAIGAVLVLGHVVLGREIVPVVVALAGAILLVAAGLYVLVADRRGSPGSTG